MGGRELGSRWECKNGSVRLTMARLAVAKWEQLVCVWRVCGLKHASMGKLSPWRPRHRTLCRPKIRALGRCARQRVRPRDSPPHGGCAWVVFRTRPPHTRRSHPHAPPEGTAWRAPEKAPTLTAATCGAFAVRRPSSQAYRARRRRQTARAPPLPHRLRCTR